ncbi:hypothetical protein Y032_0043g764 [Ancylostoma ceylanicum]|nr:hypothetical protein Y032_0043g764 [Ancylostoma ceylanicum]
MVRGIPCSHSLDELALRSSPWNQKRFLVTITIDISSSSCLQRAFLIDSCGTEYDRALDLMNSEEPRI